MENLLKIFLCVSKSAVVVRVLRVGGFIRLLLCFHPLNTSDVFENHGACALNIKALPKYFFQICLIEKKKNS